MAKLTFTRPKTQAEYDALNTQLGTLMETAVRGDVTCDDAQDNYANVVECAKVLKSCTKNARRKHDLQETIYTFTWE